MYQRRENQHVQTVNTNGCSDPPPIRIVTGKEFIGGKEKHTPVIAGIKLKKTVSFITEPS